LKATEWDGRFLDAEGKIAGQRTDEPAPKLLAIVVSLGANATPDRT
jgi:hypothetical protein